MTCACDQACGEREADRRSRQTWGSPTCGMSEGSRPRQDRRRRDHGGNAVDQTPSTSARAVTPLNCHHQHHLLLRPGVERRLECPCRHQRCFASCGTPVVVGRCPHLGGECCQDLLQVIEMPHHVIHGGHRVLART
jgi:hypothetical protein